MVSCVGREILSADLVHWLYPIQILFETWPHSEHSSDWHKCILKSQYHCYHSVRSSALTDEAYRTNNKNYALKILSVNVHLVRSCHHPVVPTNYRIPYAHTTYECNVHHYNKKYQEQVMSWQELLVASLYVGLITHYQDQESCTTEVRCVN